MADVFYPLTMSPGIQRDGTDFSGKGFIDGQWCRFSAIGNNFIVPRKIGGYKKIIRNLSHTPNAVFISPYNDFYNFYIGSANGVSCYNLDKNRNIIATYDITPSDFVDSNLGMWQFCDMYSSLDEDSVLIAHNTYNYYNINNDIESPVYVKNISDGSQKLYSIGQSASGGVVVLNPFLFLYGNYGKVAWSEPSNPTIFDGESSSTGERITSQKIVHAESCASLNNYYPGPSGLFWSLSGLYKATYVGGNEVFRFDPISKSCSILASKSVVAYDSIFYWIDNKRFMMTDGVSAREVPNSTNLRYFFNNLNFEQSQRIWGIANKENGEVWWFFPTIGNNYCDHAIIFNVRNNCWYDTSISRNCGYLDTMFSNPVCCDNNSVWEHEVGYDAYDNGAFTSIESYFKTGNIAFCAIGPDKQWQGLERQVSFNRIEPNFTQVGNMRIDIYAKDYASGDEHTIATETFDENTEKIDIRAQGREVTLKFTSDEVSGFYELGNTLLDITVGDVRPGYGSNN